jgi:pyruvate/2-oxoglutarate dehydrogenase complex dihydrolipoamide acyltransferase (E2) component
VTRAQDGYTLAPFPKLRQVYIDSLRLGHRKHTVHGLIEVDVTRARQLMREHQARTGEKLSFTGFVVACVGKAVDTNKTLHAFRNWRNQLVMFDEVDVATMFEVEVDGEKTPLAHVIRAVNKRAYQDIHQEIRAIQAAPQRSRGLEQWGFLRWFLALPVPVRQLAYRLLFRNPRLVKEYIGTVGLTAVGMFGKGGGWAITWPVYTLGIAVGGIDEKPWVVERQIEVREILSVTVSADHDIVDGGPVARFCQRLKELIESGYGLVEQAAAEEGGADSQPTAQAGTSS